MDAVSPSNFGHLRAHDEQLVRLGSLAERYFPDDPNTSLLKLRQLAEALAQLTASRVGLFAGADEKQADLLRRLQDHGILPREVGSLFHEVRKAGNDANHKLAGDHQREIVRRVESIFGLADAVEARWRSARAQVERLTPALLAKAFLGELVPQDPNNEPPAPC
jgi:hypothetical protein